MAAIADRYDLLETLGEGAEGVVYRAFDRERAVVCALKQYRGSDPAGRMRFEHEFWRLRRLAHPALVEAFDRGDDAGGPYYTMALVDGEPWPEGPLDPARALPLLGAAAGALAHLHAHGWVHGDLKPDNLRVLGPDRVVLLDLGFAQQAGRPGQRRGTLETMAPEVLRGAPADPRADVYALGTLAFALLAGRWPFDATHPLAWVDAQLHRVPHALEALRPDLPAALVETVMACLAKDPAGRPPTAGHLAARLLGGQPDADYLALGGELFGRAEPRERLLAGARERLAGRGGLLALVGPPGIGKSRLLGDLVGPDLGWQVLQAEAGADLPYELLARLVREADALALEMAIDRTNEAWAALRVFAPGWGEPPPPLEPAQQEGRLRQGLAELLRALAGDAGLVVVIDDLDRADMASRALLAPLAVNATPGLAWVATAREAVPDAEAIALAPLAEADLAALAATALAEAPAPALLERLTALSGGIPERARALLAAWHADGALARRDGRWHWHPERARAVPADLAEAGRAAWQGLAPAARRVAGAAAVLGSRGELSTLFALVGEPPFDALAELAAAELLQYGEDGYRFEGVGREVALAETDAPTRRAWHLAAAAEAASDTSLAGLVARARHLMAAEAPGCGPAVLAAGRASFEQAALATAAELLGGLVRATLAPAERQEHARLSGDLARTRGDGAAALVDYEEAIALARELGDVHALVRELVSAARAALSLSDGKRARVSLDEALPLARAHDPAQGARALVTLARLAIFEGRPGEARPPLDEALALANTPALALMRAAALAQAGTLGDPADPAARTALAEALRLHRQVGNPVGVLDASINLADRLLGAGELPEAEQVLAEALATSRQIGARAEEAFVLLNLAQARLEAGRYGAARETAREARQLAERLVMPFPAGYACVFLALAEAKQGAYDAARDALAAAEDAVAATGNRYLEAALRQVEAQIAIDLGEDAHERVETAAELARAQGDATLMARVAWLQGRQALLDGNASDAADAFLQAGDDARAAGARLAAVQLDLALASVAFDETGDGRTAALGAGEALATAEAAGARELAAEAHWLLGKVARAAGRTAEAITHFEAVRAHGLEAPAPLWAALARLGLATVTDGRAARDHHRDAERGLRTLQAASATETFWRWGERRVPPVPAAGGEPSAGLEDVVAMFGDLRAARDLPELLDRLLDRLLDVSGARAGALLTYRDAQLDRFAVRGLAEAALYEEGAIDQALWDGAEVREGEHWAFPLAQGGGVAAIAYLVEGPPEALSTSRLVATAAGEVLAHFRTLQAVEARLERLAFTESLARLALGGRSPAEVVREALASALAITGADRALVVLPGEAGTPVATRGIDRAGRELPPDAPFSRSVCQHVLDTGEPVRLMDAQNLEGWQRQLSILALGLQTIVAVPVGTAAVLYVDSTNVVQLLGEREQALVEAAADVLAPLLANA